MAQPAGGALKYLKWSPAPSTLSVEGVTGLTGAVEALKRPQTASVIAWR